MRSNHDLECYTMNHAGYGAGRQVCPIKLHQTYREILSSKSRMGRHFWIMHWINQNKYFKTRCIRTADKQTILVSYCKQPILFVPLGASCFRLCSDNSKRLIFNDLWTKQT